jgi:hypothetical protein
LSDFEILFLDDAIDDARLIIFLKKQLNYIGMTEFKEKCLLFFKAQYF